MKDRLVPKKCDNMTREGYSKATQYTGLTMEKKYMRALKCKYIV